MDFFAYPMNMVTWGVPLVLLLTYVFHKTFPSRIYPRYIPAMLSLVAALFFMTFSLSNRGWTGFSSMLLAMIFFLLFIVGLIGAVVMGRLNKV
ncbi:hypothetical protein [Melghirimyces algeriensis]|uniref:YesK-like protein n=1 Tax=Melghirimyces algeriensis TaxID=910412 RepID=A0A521C115_9BACL|nr:hypothetical protein [Melghirimyces algeriensis]SMO53074.1 hypothetical protein SAMN06264849_10355 [Melghirimyces algeriensis]